MATTAPTEMSMPRVAITSVMPSATTISGAARLRMSTRLPYRCPSRHSRCRKPGLKAALATSSSASVTSGQVRRCCIARASRPGPEEGVVSGMLCRDEFVDLVLGAAAGALLGKEVASGGSGCR